MRAHCLSRSRQSGTVLLIALVLLLLAGLLTLFALRVGVFEQHSTGNDVRSKVAGEVAEAGLAQGFEFLIRQHPDMLTNAGLWERCDAADTTFPCGAVPDTRFEVNGTEFSRRGSMYRLRADTTNTIGNIDTALSQYMLRMPTSSKITSMANGQGVAYGVAPVVCFAQSPETETSPIPCGAVGSSSVEIATFVSVARLPGENTNSTLVQTVGQYPKLGDEIVSTPPIMASGAVDVTGSLQIVTNARAGGTGVPVSVWSRLDIDKHGTPNTCYSDEFFRYTQGNHTPSIYQSTIRCDDCTCDGNGAPATLSYDTSGLDRCLSATSDCEGIDILDVDAGTNSNTLYNTGGHVGANFNVRSDSLSYPTCEFPPDMFRFVFGVKAWVDNDLDCFAETKAASVLYQNPDNGVIATMPPDEAYLYKIADKVIPTLAHQNLVRTLQNGTSALLSASSSKGIIWCQADCDISGQVGTPDAPVFLILDGPVTIHGVVFGYVFVRDTGNTLRPATGSSLSGSCPSNCMLQMNAGSAIYGALVVQGQMKVNGTAAVISDRSVLGSIVTQTGDVYATLPGAWTDRESY
jgi:Tfp pilus assembly protein PilX